MSDLIDRYAAIDVVGIDEEIRCEMCENPMHTDRGCDGGCTYDEKLYKRILQVLPHSQNSGGYRAVRGCQRWARTLWFATTSKVIVQY